MITRTISTAALMLLLMTANGWAEPAVDPAEVARQIQLLGVRDDVTGPQYTAAAWLRERRQQVIPQLADGLSDANPRVAEGCLDLLRIGPADARMVPQLLAIAGDAKNPLSKKALFALTPYGNEKQAVDLMAAAADDKERFPEARGRSRLAAAAGKTELAISLLLEIVTDRQFSSSRADAVKQLAEIGPAAIPALETASRVADWDAARTALLALDRLAPKAHGLTADQRQFLTEAGWGFKTSQKRYEERQEAFAKLDQKQIRPFVMQALASDGHQANRDALAVLTIWRDRAALPQIAQIVKGRDSGSRGEAMAAYLTIDGGFDSETLLMSQLRARDSLDNGVQLRAVMQAEMTPARRLELLRQVRAKIENPHAVPRALRWAEADELASLLAPLMDGESNLRALDSYADVAAADKQKRFGKQVRRAVSVLANRSKANDRRDSEFDSAADAILKAAVVYELKGIDADLAVLASCDRPVVQTAAIATSIRLGGPLDEGLKHLIPRLSNTDRALRNAGVAGLQTLNLTDDGERRKVEALLLPLLNSPAESSAIRLLAKFGGDEAVKTLTPMLDDPAMPRALLAAWALAQIDKPAARDAGLRRIAIYSLFQHQVYQQGGGIDFEIDDDLGFHQTTERLNPGAYLDGDEPVKLPKELLQPFPLSPAEQAFAVRGYRHTLQERRGQLQLSAMELLDGEKIDPSYLPLLKTIAGEDPDMRGVFIKDKRVATFPIRRRAAAQIARITGKPATYTGLAGDEIDSGQLPLEPYKDQAALVARFALDYVMRGLNEANPQTSREWESIDDRQRYLRTVVESFGPEVKAAVLAEAARREPHRQMKHLRIIGSWDDEPQ